MNIYHKQKYQQGVALITALVITTIAITIAATLVSRQQVSIHLASNIGALEQAYQYTLAIEDWAGVILKQDLKDNDTDSCDDAWATVIPPIPIPGGKIEGKLYDLQALININNVIGDNNKRGEQTVNEIEIKRLKSLFSNLGFTNQLELSDAILDWIDKDERDRSSLAESSYYKSLTPPYLAANGAIISLSEIRTIKGFDEKITNNDRNNINPAQKADEAKEDITLYKKVRPYLTALPNPSIAATTTNTTDPKAPKQKRTTINVNTAPAEVLLTIQGVTEAQINNIIEDRAGGAFESIADFINSIGGNNETNPIDKKGLDVRSSYFLLKGQVQINNVRLFINSVLFRDENSKQVRVIKREFNEINQNEIADTCTVTNNKNNKNNDGNNKIDTITP